MVIPPGTTKESYYIILFLYYTNKQKSPEVEIKKYQKLWKHKLDAFELLSVFFLLKTI